MTEHTQDEPENNVSQNPSKWLQNQRYSRLLAITRNCRLREDVRINTALWQAAEQLLAA